MGDPFLDPDDLKVIIMFALFFGAWILRAVYRRRLIDSTCCVVTLRSF